MKFRGTVTSIADKGTELQIDMQLDEVGAPQWSDLRRVVFVVHDKQQTRRAFYIGRRVSVTLEPR